MIKIQFFMSVILTKVSLKLIHLIPLINLFQLPNLQLSQLNTFPCLIKLYNS